MNHKAMLELADHMEKMPPEQFNMKHWGILLGDVEVVVTLKNHCGTTCCIAGEKVLLDGGKIKPLMMDGAPTRIPEFYDKKGREVFPSEYAARRLGLTTLQSKRLFLDMRISTSKGAVKRIRAMVAADQKASA